MGSLQQEITVIQQQEMGSWWWLPLLPQWTGPSPAESGPGFEALKEIQTDGAAREGREGSEGGHGGHHESGGEEWFHDIHGIPWYQWSQPVKKLACTSNNY